MVGIGNDSEEDEQETDDHVERRFVQRLHALERRRPANESRTEKRRPDARRPNGAAVPDEETADHQERAHEVEADRDRAAERSAQSDAERDGAEEGDACSGAEEDRESTERGVQTDQLTCPLDGRRISSSVSGQPSSG